MSTDSRTTDFGYKKVPWEEKTTRVREVFDSVASRYDLMNDLMSFGLHRAWKASALARTGLREGRRALDVAGGSGDLTAGLARQVGRDGRVVLSDINPHMLEQGRRRLVDAGVSAPVDYVRADAERLPFAARSFHCVTIGFGLRNVTDKQAALASMYRVLRPGGRLLVLEFSHPVVQAMRPFYDLYSFSVLPRLGSLVAGDADSYRYLAESIRMHPGQEELKSMMEQAGFERVSYENYSGGIVALHIGFRI